MGSSTSHGEHLKQGLGMYSKALFFYVYTLEHTAQHYQPVYRPGIADDGLIKEGSSITMPVVGRPVCYCCETDLAMIGEEIKLKSIIIVNTYAVKKGIETSYWIWVPGLKKLIKLK